MSSLPWLNESDFEFPPVESALREPNGLLAAGGNLTPDRLLEAYRKGIFPWYEDTQPILWWTPDPRMVLFPEELHISRSLAKAMRKQPYRITSDQAFARVIRACAGDRYGGAGTWITSAMIAAYCELHAMGAAHSVEAWEGEELVGGVYGIALDNIFFGESMFSRRDNASKIAFVTLVRKLQALGYHLVDCQVSSPFLESLGARDIPRSEFMTWLPKDTDYGRNSTHWPLQ